MKTIDKEGIKWKLILLGYKNHPNIRVIFFIESVFYGIIINILTNWGRL